MGRYTNEKRVWMPGRVPGTSVEVVVRPPTIFANTSYVRLTATAGDTIPNMSHRQYGNCHDYWAIADLNPKLYCPHDLRAGMPIAVPVAT